MAFSSSMDTELYFDKEILKVTMSTIQLLFCFLSSGTEY